MLAAAREYLTGTAARMRTNRIENEDLWGLWHLTMGKVELRAGNALEAERHLLLARPWFSRRALAKAGTKFQIN